MKLDWRTAAIVGGCVILAGMAGLALLIPNPASGSSDPESITLGPTSPVIGMLNDLNRFSKPDDFLNKNSAELSKLLLSVTSLQNKLNEGDSAFSSFTPSQKTEFKTLLDQTASQIKQIQANPTDKDKVKDLGSKILANIKKLNAIAAIAGLTNVSASLVQWSKSLADFNNPDHKKIPYVFGSGHPPQVNTSGNLTGPVDCSGFINYILYKAGVFKSIKQATLTVVGYGDLARGGNSGFTYVYKPNDTATGEEVLKNAQIRPGDLILMRSGKSQSGYHIGIYIGGNDPEKNAVHSSGSKSGGPQYASLSNWKNIIGVVRPPGV